MRACQHHPGEEPRYLEKLLPALNRLIKRKRHHRLLDMSVTGSLHLIKVNLLHGLFYKDTSCASAAVEAAARVNEGNLADKKS